MDYSWLASFLFFGLSRAFRRGRLYSFAGGAGIISSKEIRKRLAGAGGFSNQWVGVRFRGPCRARLDTPSGNK
jgi:hypothetical protein